MSERTVQFLMLMPADLHAEFKQAAGTRGMGPLVRSMIEDWLEQERARARIARLEGEGDRQ